MNIIHGAMAFLCDEHVAFGAMSIRDQANDLSDMDHSRKLCRLYIRTTNISHASWCS